MNIQFFQAKEFCVSFNRTFGAIFEDGYEVEEKRVRKHLLKSSVQTMTELFNNTIRLTLELLSYSTLWNINTLFDNPAEVIAINR